MVVTFFGHRNTSESIKEKLEVVLIDLIENKNATKFLFGNNGAFDSIVKSTIKQLKNKYPHISYSVVLAYLPQKSSELDFNDYSDTVYPEDVAKAPKKYAIVYRNKWLIKNSDIVVVNVTRFFGGAAQFKELAEKQGKTVINLADLQ